MYCVPIDKWAKTAQGIDQELECRVLYKNHGVAGSNPVKFKKVSFFFLLIFLLLKHKISFSCFCTCA